jgi:hypothetical protein
MTGAGSNLYLSNHAGKRNIRGDVWNSPAGKAMLKIRGLKNHAKLSIQSSELNHRLLRLTQILEIFQEPASTLTVEINR